MREGVEDGRRGAGRDAPLGRTKRITGRKNEIMQNGRAWVGARGLRWQSETWEEAARVGTAEPGRGKRLT